MQNVSELTPISLSELKEMAKQCNMWRIFLHWSAGHYGQVYSDYHISIDHNGKIYLPYNCKDLNEYREHTWQRNSGSIGIAIMGCFDACARPYDLGSEPVTKEQIESISNVVAVLCKYGGISMNNVMTHEEIAVIDGYGPGSLDPETRWDLWYLEDYDGEWRNGGDVIRGKARFYMPYV